MRKGHLQYHWWKYLLILLVAVFGWSWAFHAMAQPAANERLHILLVGEDFKADALQTHLQEWLPTVTDQQLREIKVSQSNIQGDEAYRVLQGRFYEYDLIIISADYLPPHMEAALDYTALPLAFLQKFQDATLYIQASQDGVAAYGFEVNDTAVIGQYHTGATKYYAFPSPWSENYAGLNGVGAAHDDSAYLTLKYLMIERGE